MIHKFNTKYNQKQSHLLSWHFSHNRPTLFSQPITYHSKITLTLKFNKHWNAFIRIRKSHFVNLWPLNDFWTKFTNHKTYMLYDILLSILGLRQGRSKCLPGTHPAYGAHGLWAWAYGPWPKVKAKISKMMAWRPSSSL